MKKYLKYVECFLLFIAFCMIVYASQEEIDKAKEAMKKYCLHDYQGLKGCIYDEHDTLYTRSGKIKNTETGFWSGVSFTTDDLKIERGYVTANAKGELLFAGCYKGHYNGGDWIGPGDYFVFKIVALDGNKCKMIEDDVVFAKGTKWKVVYDPLGFITGWDEEFDGTSMGAQMATYLEWTAKNGGDCPLGFGLTANTRWYTSTKNRYVFSNDAQGFNIGVNSFWGNEAYVTTPGCTVKDETGHQLAEECFNTASNNIKNTSCPKDYKDLGKVAGTLEKYQDSCDSKFRTLYSKGLLEKDANEMKAKLVTAVKEKLTSCQAKQCKVTDAQVNSISSILTKDDYKSCAKGSCPAPQDMSVYQKGGEGAKCYRIKNGWDAHFEWTNSPSEQPATVEANMKQSECYGTYTTQNCRSCLKRAYKEAGLNQEQIDCMLYLEADKGEMEKDSEEEIDKQFDEKTEEKLKENEEIIERSYKSYETPEIDVKLPEEDKTLTECIRILGKDLAAIVKASITILQIVGAIIAIVKGMMTLVPPILAKDADALKKAGSTLTKMAIILVIIFLFKPLLNFIGGLLDFDTSCIV